jgi:hypothetical protein
MNPPLSPRRPSNLDPGSCARRYSIFILVVEGIGVTALLPYALLLTRSILPRRGATGLPAAKHTKTGMGPQYP